MTNLKATEIPVCAQQKLGILPQTYPEAGIFIGYNHVAPVQSLISQLLNELQYVADPPKLNVIIPGEQVASAKGFVERLERADREKLLNIIETKTDSGFWAQDILEIFVDSSTSDPVIYEIPYDVERGNEVPQEIAAACGFESSKFVVPEMEYLEAGSGNYGGNIEALPGLGLLVGNSMSPSMKLELEKLQSSLIELNVSWLKTAHVDEVISILRDPSQNAPCNFAITYPSPSLALNVLEHSPAQRNERLSPLVSDEFEIEDTTSQGDYEDCFKNDERADSKKCQSLKQANQIYQQILNENIALIKNEIETRLKCNSIKYIPLPQLFVPESMEGPFGTEQDQALALNPNAVNNVVIRNLLILPSQGVMALNHRVETQLAPLGLKLIYADPSLVHNLDGGLHCTTNTLRVCKPLDPKSEFGRESRF